MSFPVLVVITAPSGAGKTTLCDRLLGVRKDMTRSVSCTTRSSRGGEINGRDYWFVSSEEFESLILKGEFLEYAVVHGHKYGTRKKNVVDQLKAGKSVVLTIDVQGAAKVREVVARAPEGDILKTALVDVFVMPPSTEMLRKRLTGRGEDDDNTICLRLENAGAEMKRAGEFSHIIVNDDLDRAVQELNNIVEKEQEKHV